MERPSTPDRAHKRSAARPVQVDVPSVIPPPPGPSRAAPRLNGIAKPSDTARTHHGSASAPHADHWPKARELGGLYALRYTEVLRELAAGPLCINDLTNRLQLEQSYVSRTMQVLRDLGLVEFEAHGAKHIYRLTRQVGIARLGDRIILAIGNTRDCIAILSVADSATSTAVPTEHEPASIHDILAMARLALAGPDSRPPPTIARADVHDDLITLRPLEPRSPAPDGHPPTRRGPTGPGSK